MRLAIPALLCLAACSGPPTPAVEANAAKSALVTAYEARLDAIVDRADTCAEALSQLQQERTAWAPVWKLANAPPEPPMTLHCGDGGRP